jgi:hypothetical protein
MFPKISRLSMSSSEYSTSEEARTYRKNPENGAVVVKSHSGWILLRHWIHVAAALVTAGLAALNILNVYLMDSDDPNAIIKLNAFQFAAKLHEILIVGSLMLILMDTVRSALISSTGVPFGFLMAPVLFNDLNWLTSHQFWTAMKPTRSSLPLALLVFLAVPFANVAGPLSAITVVPRPGWSQPRPAAVFPTVSSVSFWNLFQLVLNLDVCHCS